MKKLPVTVLALFFVFSLAIPAYGDVQHESKEGHRIGQAP